MVSALPVAGSTADTDVILPDSNMMLEVIGIVSVEPTKESTGAVPVPSQPSVMLPNGARNTPPWEMVDA